MCGRFGLFHPDVVALLQAMGIDTGRFQGVPNYNVAPSQGHAMIVKQEQTLKVIRGIWGIVPSWAKKGQIVHNAKIETVMDKPTFKQAYVLHRCAIPVSGFYEWHSEAEGKQPYWFHRMNDEVYFLAGFYYPMSQHQPFVLLTTQAAPWMQPYHHRMPVMLHKDELEQWFSTQAVTDKQAYEGKDILLNIRKVSKKVNQGSAQGPDLVQGDEVIQEKSPSL
jgi:putative SOS response-associated peptidase YedK